MERGSPGHPGALLSGLGAGIFCKPPAPQLQDKDNPSSQAPALTGKENKRLTRGYTRALCGPQGMVLRCPLPAWLGWLPTPGPIGSFTLEQSKFINNDLSLFKKRLAIKRPLKLSDGGVGGRERGGGRRGGEGRGQVELNVNLHRTWILPCCRTSDGSRLVLVSSSLKQKGRCGYSVSDTVWKHPAGRSGKGPCYEASSIGMHGEGDGR